jgi:hypothetical protein
MASITSSLIPTDRVKRQASRTLEEREAQEQAQALDDFDFDVPSDNHNGSRLKKKSSSGQDLFNEALGGSDNNNPTFQNRKVLKVKKSSFLHKKPSNASIGDDDADIYDPGRSNSNNSLQGGLNLSLGQNSFFNDSPGDNDVLNKQMSVDSDNNTPLGSHGLNISENFLNDIDNTIEVLNSYSPTNGSLRSFSNSSMNSMYKKNNNNNNNNNNNKKPLPRTTSNGSTTSIGGMMVRQESLDAWGTSSDFNFNIGGESSFEEAQGLEMYEDMMDDEEIMRRELQKTETIMVNSELSDNFGNIDMNNTPDPSPRNNNSNPRQRRSFTEQIAETVGNAFEKTTAKFFGKGRKKSTNNNNNNNSTSGNAKAKPKPRKKKPIETKTSEEVKRVHKEAQLKHRNQIGKKMERVKEAVRLKVDYGGEYKETLGRMTKIDFYVAVIGIANNDTEEQVVHRILNKRNELAAKRKDNETKQNRFKRLRLSEKAVLGELQDLICNPQIKITIANTLDQAAEFLEDKLGPDLLE